MMRGSQKDLPRPAQTPFDPDGDPDLYRRWRDRKLAACPGSAADLRVDVSDPERLSDAEAEAMLDVIRKTNMVIYRAPAHGGPRCLRALAAQMGLRGLDRNLLAGEDGLSALRVTPEKQGRGYIPYSNKRLLWHTDGYYNPPSRRIRAMALHCVRPAPEGGWNRLLDPEILYIHMREADPEHVRVLMAPDALTIPANTEAGEACRPAETGPVFSIDPVTGDLHMRYTARVRSIRWKEDRRVQRAVRWLEDYLGTGGPHVYRLRLEAGEGIICNNVLHDRSAFVDGDSPEQQRLIYRGRYHERVRDTHWHRLLEPEDGHVVPQ